ncbi:hypothetical protein ACIA5A_28075 [Micromonospora sp. NPDC051300]|uniref:hypothetical protein n=1 Tax=Micromonospora sp. NPDC051300 TaxID=3364286 RepID=UPI0037903092
MITPRLPMPGPGPRPDRPRAYGTAVPHTPVRPSWACRADGEPWPCAHARLALKAEYDRNLAALTIYLAGLLFEAMRDFYHLNPHDGPSPQQMYQRFLGWSPFRRPIVEPAD